MLLQLLDPTPNEGAVPSAEPKDGVARLCVYAAKNPLHRRTSRCGVKPSDRDEAARSRSSFETIGDVRSMVSM